MITLLKDHDVCKEGDLLTPEQARILVSWRFTSGKLYDTQHSVVACLLFRLAPFLSTETLWYRDGRIQSADQMYVELRNKWVWELCLWGRVYAGQWGWRWCRMKPMQHMFLKIILASFELERHWCWNYLWLPALPLEFPLLSILSAQIINLCPLLNFIFGLNYCSVKFSDWSKDSTLLNPLVLLRFLTIMRKRFVLHANTCLPVLYQPKWCVLCVTKTLLQ